MLGTSATVVLDGRPLIAFVAVDPTNDLDPRDAQVVWWQSTVFTPDRANIEWVGTGPARPRAWQYVATPHLTIDAPAVWIGFRFPPDTLINFGASSSSPASVIGQTFNGPEGGTGRLTWLVNTIDAPALDPAQALASSQLLPSPFIATLEAYSHGCPMTGDVDGNGRVDGADLGRLLGDWGPAYGSPCDLNHDNSVDGADLAILIAHFGD
jgi:hypothetical protein